MVGGGNDYTVNIFAGENLVSMLGQVHLLRMVFASCRQVFLIDVTQRDELNVGHLHDGFRQVSKPATTADPARFRVSLATNPLPCACWWVINRPALAKLLVTKARRFTWDSRLLELIIGENSPMKNGGQSLPPDDASDSCPACLSSGTI